MFKRTIFIVLSLLAYQGIGCQSNYEIFRQAVTEVYQSTQASKSSLEKAVTESEKSVSKYRNEKPQITVIGGTPEQNKQLEEEMIEIVEDVMFEDALVEDVPPPPPPPPPAPSQSRQAKTKEQKANSISFTQEPMFPDRPQGRKLLSQEQRANQPREKIEWVEGPSFTHTETIHIDDATQLSK